jgi:phosphoglycolate phosphatase-like HAD superfamily hydrolase
MALKNQLKLIFKWVENINYDLILNEIYKKLLSNDAEFYEWVIEKIIDLKDNYKLFLTTWNSTQVAKKYLEKWWIINYFELIYWSDEILKWEEHLEIFKEYTWDKDFYKKAIYVWDWDMDKEFAYSKNIDFIRVWYKWESDENRIKSVAEIDNILNNLS